MSNNTKLYYKTCREQAGLTQEQAIVLLGISEIGTLFKYENGHLPVSSALAAEMVKVYRVPSLAIWHFPEEKREHSERGRAAEAEAFGKIQILRSNLTRHENSLSEINRDLEHKRQIVAEIEKKREEIRTAHIQKQGEYIKIQNETFDESLTVCDKCGQALPSDRITDYTKISTRERQERQI